MIMRVAKDKASDSDEISNRILKAVKKWLVLRLIMIFNISVCLGYHFKA